MFYQLKYTNEQGESIHFKPISTGFVDTLATNEINGHTPFMLMKFEGFGEVDALVQTQKSPYQDGSTHIDSLLEERTPYLEFVIRADNYAELSLYRKQVSRVFNPKIKGKFELTHDDQAYVIDAHAEHVPAFTEEDRTGGVQTASVNLVCPNPYWQSPTVTEEPMAAFVELFEFPSDYWEVGEDGDLYFEMGTEGHTRMFMNNSDAPVPIKIKIKGPTLNPTLTNLTTDEFIKINRELKEDDILEISTESGNKYILLNGEDVFNWIALGSTFWELQEGRNEVQYTADAGQESATLTIEWQEQFVGV